MEALGPLLGVHLDGTGRLAHDATLAADRLSGRIGGPTISAPSPTATPGADASSGSFLDALGDALTRLNDELVAADATAADFAAGGSTDLHDVVLALTEAGLGLRLGVAVRDRLLEAYQDVMRLQI